MAKAIRERNLALSNLRELRGLSQDEVADGLHDLARKYGETSGATGNDVSRWERGQRPKPLNRRLLAEFYGVSLAELGFARQRPAPGYSAAHLNGPPIDLLDLDDADAQDPRVIGSQEQWLTIRRAMNGRQPALHRLATLLYPEANRVGDSGLLSRPDWHPTEPIDLDAITLTYDPAAPAPAVDGTGEAARDVLPLWSEERRFPRYSYAVRDIARPTLFENRPCWRITDATFGDGKGELTFGDMNYFDAIDTCEAVAHELAANHIINEGQLAPASWQGLRLRRQIGDPLDFTRRPGILSINTLTIRRDRHEASIVLHSRSAANVATSGGVISVMPAGVFQPSTVRKSDHDADFDLWRNIMREYSEEFLGNAEHGGDDKAADYTEEPFASLDQARNESRIKVYAFGVAVGALDLWNALETVAVFDAEVFDEIFLHAVKVNSEGTVVHIGKVAPTSLIPFTEATLAELNGTGRLAVETRFSLAHCWEHREQLLGGS
jgi:transcriptional regulator with XRE-family HTH domain